MNSKFQSIQRDPVLGQTAHDFHGLLLSQQSVPAPAILMRFSISLTGTRVTNLFTLHPQPSLCDLQTLGRTALDHAPQLLSGVWVTGLLGAGPLQ